MPISALPFSVRHVEDHRPGHAHPSWGIHHHPGSKCFGSRSNVGSEQLVGICLHTGVDLSRLYELLLHAIWRVCSSLFLLLFLALTCIPPPVALGTFDPPTGGLFNSRESRLLDPWHLFSTCAVLEIMAELCLQAYFVIV